MIITGIVIAGIGCRRNASADAIEAVIDAALAACNLERGELTALATAAEKGVEPGLRAAAGRLALCLVLVGETELRRVSGAVLTISERVVALKGVPSIAETAALAAAGAAARLLAPRISNAQATCAIAVGEGR
jgi:cobalt-precorrin 5A hydrolase